MNDSFHAYRLNPDVKRRIADMVKEPEMQTFLVWLLEWEGKRLHGRVASLADVTKAVDELAEEMNENS